MRYSIPTFGIRSFGRCSAGLVLVMLFAGLPPVVRAEMRIREFDAARHDRFYDEPDKDFIGVAYDWSGVGKSGNRWVTMISPIHFLSAEHFEPTGDVTFYEENDLSGTSHTYQIASGKQIGTSDLWLGTLATSVHSTIAYYPVLELDSAASYIGRELYNYGAGKDTEQRVGRNVIEDIVKGVSTDPADGNTGVAMLFDFDNNDVITVGGDETYLQSGDSGAPSFTVWNNGLALLGIHWFNSGTAGVDSGDTFVPAYLDDLNANMTGYSVTVVPEPATMALWLLGLVSMLAIARRRR